MFEITKKIFKDKVSKIKDNIDKSSKKSSSEEISLEQLIDFLNLKGTRKSELNEATYFACLKILSENLGKLPLKLFKYSKEDGISEARDHPLYRIIRYRPNPYMTSTTFWGTVELIRNHYGNAYVWRDGVGKGAKLWILPNNQVQVFYDNAKILKDFTDIFYIYTPANGKRYILSSDEVLHFKSSVSFDGITGVAVRDQLRSNIDGNNKSQEMVNKLYENGFTAKAVVQYTSDLNDDLVKKFVNKIENYATGQVDGSKNIIPLPVGTTLTPLNIKLTDGEFLETKKYSALQIAAAFGIKPNQINDYDKSSYSSSELQQLAFYIDTLLYILKQYEEEINAKLLTDEEMMEGFYFKFNVAVLLRMDSKSQIESLSKAIANFLYTPNEARAFLDMPAKPGGDSLIGNGSVIKAEQIGIQYEKKKGVKSSE